MTKTDAGRTMAARKRSPSLDLVGSREIAGRLRVSIRTVQQWRARGVMPKPDFVFNMDSRQHGLPVWYWSTIEAWSAKRGNPPQRLE